MDEILSFLMLYGYDFYKKYGFRFIDSEVATSFGNACIALNNIDLKLSFILEKGQMLLNFQSNYDKKKNNWYSIDLVRQLITGEAEYYSILDEPNVHFIKNSIVKIIDVIKKDTIDVTLKQLDLLKTKREKILYS